MGALRSEGDTPRSVVRSIGSCRPISKATEDQTEPTAAPAFNTGGGRFEVDDLVGAEIVSPLSAVMRHASNGCPGTRSAELLLGPSVCWARAAAGSTSIAMSGSDFNLEQARRELQTRLGQTRERLEALTKPPERGTAQGFGKRVGDGTTEAVRRLTDIGVGNSMERERARIERALVKLDEGTYGICDVCGDPIPPGRLHALPESGLCLACKKLQPRRLAPRR
jgi:DnaK suppressor protein